MLKIAGIVLVALVIQCIGLYFFDPLNSPDTIRYINLANFFGNPQGSQYGDLAYKNGLLFTPLFLPFYLVLLNNISGLSYEYSGLMLNLVSLLVIICVCYLSAFKTGGRAAARIALALLLTNLVFCFQSIFILTEYPFMAVLLCITYYLLDDTQIDIKKAFNLSLLFALLISIRTQGFVFLLAAVLYLLWARRMRLKHAPVFFIAPLLYYLAYIYFYLYMDKRFPATVTINEWFSFKYFFLGGNFSKYSFPSHGLDTVIESVGFTNIMKFVKAACSAFSIRKSMQYGIFVSKMGIEPFLLLILTMISSFIYAKVKYKALFVSLILGNFLAIAAFLNFGKSFIRYHGVVFPLAVILLAAYISHEYRRLKESGRNPLFSAWFFVLISYTVFFFMQQQAFFRGAGLTSGDFTESPKNLAIRSSDIIYDAVGRGRKIVSASPINYGIIYRSGNTPLYYAKTWNDQELSDYITAHSASYFIGDSGMMVKLRNSRHVRIRLVASFFIVGGNRLFLCNLSRRYT